jgi:hypothetical protein
MFQGRARKLPQSWGGRQCGADIVPRDSCKGWFEITGVWLVSASASALASVRGLESLFSAGTSVPASAHALAILLAAKSCAAAGGGVMRSGCRMPQSTFLHPSIVIPRLDQDKRSEVAVERQAKRRRQTGGPSTPGAGRACVLRTESLRWIPDHVMDFQSTRSGMTVGEKRESRAGKPPPSVAGQKFASSKFASP